MSDACHLLKLLRNALGQLKVFKWNGDFVKREYIVWLWEEQLKTHLHLANKISREAIKFDNEKMNVAIAARTLSRSVSKLLDC